MDATHQYPPTPFYPRRPRPDSYPSDALIPAWYVTSDGVVYPVQTPRAFTSQVTPILFPDPSMNRMARIGVAVYFDETLATRVAIARTRARLTALDEMIDPLVVKRAGVRARYLALRGLVDDEQTA